MKMTFCLRDAKAKGLTSLYGFVHWTFSGLHYQWKLSTGERIEPKLWDRRRRKAKKGAALESHINGALTKIESNVRTTFAGLEALRKPLTPGTVRGHYNNLITGKTAAPAPREFYADYALFLEPSKDKRRKQSIAIHHTTIAHLREFSKKYGVRIDYDQCTMILFEKFLGYLAQVARTSNSRWGNFFGGAGVSRRKCLVRSVSGRGIVGSPVGRCPAIGVDLIRFQPSQQHARSARCAVVQVGHLIGSQIEFGGDLTDWRACIAQAPDGKDGVVGVLLACEARVMGASASLSVLFKGSLLRVITLHDRTSE